MKHLLHACGLCTSGVPRETTRPETRGVRTALTGRHGLSGERRSRGLIWARQGPLNANPGPARAGPHHGGSGFPPGLFASLQHPMGGHCRPQALPGPRGAVARGSGPCVRRPCSTCSAGSGYNTIDTLYQGANSQQTLRKDMGGFYTKSPCTKNIRHMQATHRCSYTKTATSR